MPRLTDVVVVTGAAARRALWLATSGWPRSKIPRDVAALDTNFLTAALQKDFPGVRVCRVGNGGANAGTTQRAHLHLEYADGGAPNPPGALFVKLAPSDAKTRLFVSLLGLAVTEVRFYRQLGGHLPIEHIRVFSTAKDRRGGRFILVCEDLAVRGARFTDVSAHVDLGEARSVMGTLAQLHAAFWESPRFASDLSWLRCREHNPNVRLERLLWAVAVAPGVERYRDLVPGGLRAATTRVVAAYDRLETAWAAGPRTLIHGDAHVGNMYFIGNTAGLLDWQVVQRGQGMRDVSYFLINSLATELRRAHQRELIQLYLECLRVHGVAAPSPDAVWEQYRLHSLYTWIAAAITASAATLQAAPIVRAGLARSSAAVMDLEALQML